MAFTDEQLRSLATNPEAPTSTTLLARELIELKANPRDGFHTMAELYDQRMLYHALAVKMMSALATVLGPPSGLPEGVRMLTKSWRHHDGEPCFGKTEPGERWFILTMHLPDGAQVSQHYPEAEWDLFDVPVVEVAPEWDGHTPEAGNARLRNYIERPR